MATTLRSSLHEGVTVRFRSNYRGVSDYIISTPGTWDRYDSGVRISVDNNTHTVSCQWAKEIGLPPEEVKALMIEYVRLDIEEYLRWYDRTPCLTGEPDTSAFPDYSRYTFA